MDHTLPITALAADRKASYHHQANWLWVNLTGMATAAGLWIAAGRADPYGYCDPGPLGGPGDLVAVLITLLFWAGNSVALLAAMRRSSPAVRAGLFKLWLLTPVCWVLFCSLAVDIAGPACQVPM